MAVSAQKLLRARNSSTVPHMKRNCIQADGSREGLQSKAVRLKEPVGVDYSGPGQPNIPNTMQHHHDGRRGQLRVSQFADHIDVLRHISFQELTLCLEVLLNVRSPLCQPDMRRNSGYSSTKRCISWQV